MYGKKYRFCLLNLSDTNMVKKKKTGSNNESITHIIKSLKLKWSHFHIYAEISTLSAETCLMECVQM